MRGLLAAAVALAIAGPAGAHDGKTASDVEIVVRGLDVRVQVLVTLQDLDGVVFLDTDADGTISMAEGAQIRKNLVDFGRRTWETTTRPAALEFTRGETECESTFPIALSALGGAQVVLTLEYRSSRPPDSLRLAVHFPDAAGTHEPHECRVRVRWAGVEEEAVLVGTQQLEFRSSAAAGASAPDGAADAPGPRQVLRALIPSLTFWGLAIRHIAVCPHPRESSLTALGYALGIAAGLALLAGRLALAPTALQALPALALAWVGAENALVERSGWRWALAGAAGTCQGLALAGGSATGLPAALAAAGAALAAAIVPGLAVATVRRRRAVPGTGSLRLVLGIALALGGIVLAVGHGTGRL